jgi:hypothetical protein
MLISGNLKELVRAKTIDYDKNTEITHDCRLLLVAERISLYSKETTYIG